MLVGECLESHFGLRCHKHAIPRLRGLSAYLLFFHVVESINFVELSILGLLVCRVTCQRAQAYEAEEERRFVRLQSRLLISRAGTILCRSIWSWIRRVFEFFDELSVVNTISSTPGESPNLLECFVVDEAGCVFWDLELPFLNVLAELPVRA